MQDDDLTTRVDRLESLVARLDAENTELRAQLDRPDAAPAPRSDAPTAPPPAPGGAVPVGRRSVLTKGLAAAGAVTAGAVALGAQPAAAANGDPLLLGRSNAATAATILSTSGGTGLYVGGSPQVAISAGTAVATGIGVVAEGPCAPLFLAPRTSEVQPPDDAIGHVKGEVVVDTYGNLWFCTTTGNPGVWRSLSGPTHAGAFYPWATPVRAYDSRPGTNPTSPGPKTKLAGGVARLVNLRTSGAATPQTKGVLVQVLLVNAAAGNGNFTIWSGSAARPLANTLVWGGSSGRFSTLAYTNVADTGTVQVSASLGTDLVLDVIGVYG